MSVKPETEIYRYNGGTAHTKAQSIVECRLSGMGQGEISAILAVRATAVLTDARAADGEIRYSGKLLLCLIYENAEKTVCRAERGVEFSHFARDEKISPACTPFVKLQVLSTTLRREGASMYASCVVEADITARGEHDMNYLVGGEGIICKTQTAKVCNELYCGGETELSDEFECEFVTDVLLHSECISVQKCEPTVGGMLITGEVAINICALKSDGIVNFERLLPFRVELPCDGVSTSDFVEAYADVISVQIDLTTDEEKGKSKTVCGVQLSLQGTAYHLEERSMGVDAFSTENELELVRGGMQCEYCAGVSTFTERISGIASLSSPIDFTATLQALTLQKAECEWSQTEQGGEIQGVASAVLLVADSDGTHRGIDVQLPFILPYSANMSGTYKVSVLVCGMAAHQKREGELEVEGTVKVSVSSYHTLDTDYLERVVCGAEIKPSDCAFSIFLPCEGDTLWDIAKALKKSPQAVQSENSELTFPVPKGERIIVYRQKE